MTSQSQDIQKHLEKLKKDIAKRLSQQEYLYHFDRKLRQDENDLKSTITLSEAFDAKNNCRLLLLGEPGGGKSISLLQFAQSQVNKNGNHLIPIFAEIYTWTDYYKEATTAIREAKEAREKEKKAREDAEKDRRKAEESQDPNERTKLDKDAEDARKKAEDARKEAEKSRKEASEKLHNPYGQEAEKQEIAENLYELTQKEISQKLIIKWLSTQTELNVKQKIQEKRILLILDGLDELPSNEPINPSNIYSKREDYRVEFKDGLKHSEFQDVAIVMSCRRRDYDQITNSEISKRLNISELFLNRLEKDEIEDYIKQSLKDNNEKDRSRLLYLLTKKQNALLNLVRTPFLLNTLVSTYKKRTINRDREILHSVDRLGAINASDQLFDLFIEEGFARLIEEGFTREKDKLEKRKNQGLPESVDYLKQNLGAIAIKIMSDADPEDIDISPETFRQVFSDKDKRKQFQEIARNLQLLFESSQGKVYRFRHQLLRNYFACYYAREFLKRNLNTKNNILTENKKPDTKNNVVEKNVITKFDIARALGKIDDDNVYSNFYSRAVGLLQKLSKDKEEDTEVRIEATNSLSRFVNKTRFIGYETDFSNCVISYSPSCFTLEETGQYIQKFASNLHLQLDSLDLQRIHEFSQGIPLVVNLVAIELRENIPLSEITDSLGSGYSRNQIISEACKRFLINLKYFGNSKQDRKVFYILTMIDDNGINTNSELFKKLLGIEDGKGLGQKLSDRYSFISLDKDILKLDTQHRFYFQKYLLEKRDVQKETLSLEEDRDRNSQDDDSLLVKDISREARTYFDNSFTKTMGVSLTTGSKIVTEQWIINQDNRNAIANWLYYWFWSSQDNGWRYLIPYLVKGWYYDLDWADRLLAKHKLFFETFINPDDRMLTQLFQEVLSRQKKGNFALWNDENYLLEELEEKISRGYLKEEESIVIVRFKRGNFFLNQKEYIRAQGKYEKIKSNIPEQADRLEDDVLSKLEQVEKYLKQEKELDARNINRQFENAFENVFDRVLDAFQGKQEQEKTADLESETLQKEPVSESSENLDSNTTTKAVETSSTYLSNQSASDRLKTAVLPIIAFLIWVSSELKLPLAKHESWKTAGFFFLIGFCWGHPEIRNFIYDRIKNLICDLSQVIVNLSEGVLKKNDME